MALHLGVVAVDVDRLAALLRELDGELDGKAVGRREREGLLAGDGLAARELLEQAQAPLERLSEAFLLLAEDTRDLVRLGRKLGKGGAHLLDDDAGQPMHVGESDALRLLDGAADDPAQDVAAPFVRRRDAVPDEERHAAAVVGEHAVRLRRRRRVAVADARLGSDPLHDLAVSVRVVDGHHVLQDRRAALEPEPGVDVLRGQRSQRAVRVLLVLHEHEVPELEEARAARAARARSPVRRSRARCPSRSRARSRARRAPARRPTRSSPPWGAARCAPDGIPTFCQRSIATSSGPSFSCGPQHGR